MEPISTQTMKEIDRWARETLGIPTLCLMENAGAAVAHHLEADWPGKQNIVVLVGKGHNGGDGLVAARHLVSHGHAVTLFLCGFSHETIPEPDPFGIHFRVATSLNLPWHALVKPKDLTTLKKALKHATVLIDAILGTGATGPPKGILASILETVLKIERTTNRSLRIVAVDVPTGLDGDLGTGTGPILPAHLTVTFHRPKVGLLHAPQYTGKLVVADIGIPTPPESSHPKGPKSKQLPLLQYFVSQDRDRLLATRKPSSHKGSYGRVLVVAGSHRLTGAAVLASQAAYRSGAGLVTLATIQSAAPILDSLALETMVAGYPETAAHTLTQSAFQKIAKSLGRFTALAIGPGISLDPETGEGFFFLLKRLRAKHANLPCVIDADGLGHLAAVRKKLHTLLPKQVILTPHPGEMARLTGISTDAVERNRVRLAKQCAKKWKAVLVLKGNQTVIASPQGEVWVNSTGNPGMATGGVGDVLAGVITGFLAQGLPLFQAACLGAYVHGQAGDLAEQQGGMLSLTASDVLHYLPEAMT